MICRVPAYEAFLRAANFGPTYAWQKRFLRYLQLSSPTKQWILKSPDHVHTLQHLLAVFPGAVIIQTHRNPLEVLKSSIRLTGVLEGTFARADDRAQIWKKEVRNLDEHIESMTSFQEGHPELKGCFIDVQYHQLVADPLAVIRQIYQRLDRPLTKMAATRMQCLASKRSRYKGFPGGRRLDNLEMDVTALTRRFKGYCSRFGIP